VTFNTLRAEIRHIVDDAEARLTAPEIYALVTRRASKPVFGVTLCQMVDDKQLSKRKAKKRSGMGVRFTYGPGRVAVIDAITGGARAPRKVMGFMAMRREREAKARKRCIGNAPR
jgi:hypothetical protein